MPNLQNYYDVVENSLRELGLDPTKCRGENAGQWSLTKGSAFIRVSMTYFERENASYFQVIAPVMQVPATNTQQFYQELLELSFTFYGASFVKFEDWIFVKVIREADGLDAKEAGAMINRVAWYADEYDDKLKARYGIAPGAGGAHGD